MKIIYVGNSPHTSGLSDLLNVNTSKKIISTETQNEIDFYLPDGVDLAYTQPTWFKDNDLVILNDSEIIVTFVDEKSGGGNVFGFFVYELDKKPSVTSDIKNLYIIFPHASNSANGGNMMKGDSIKLPFKSTVITDSNGYKIATPTNYTFTKGVGLGFVLINKGWDGEKVVSGTHRVSTLVDINPEQSVFQRYHSLAIPLETMSEHIVMGFEETRLEPGFRADKDYNDLIIAVNAYPFTAISEMSYNVKEPETNNPPSDYIIGYKKVFDYIDEYDPKTQQNEQKVVECVAKLLIPIASVVVGNSFQETVKYRTNSAYIANIYECKQVSQKWNRTKFPLVGRKHMSAKSHNYNHFVYTVGDWVTSAVSGEYTCGEGIHYFDRFEDAEAYTFTF